MKKLLLRVVGASLFACLVAACSTVSAGSSAQPGLDGTAWVLADLAGVAPQPGTVVTLQFAGNQVSGSDGCNRFSGHYAPGTTGLEVGQLAATQMACAPEIMRQAQAVTGAIAGARSYRIAGDSLELLDAAGQRSATFKAQSTDLAGTQWTATGINNGKGSVASLVADSTVTLEFGTDGRVSGTAGCNRYTAGYTAGPGRLQFGDAAVTRRMCATPGLMQQEQAYLEALKRVATARIEGDRLELRGADGALAAQFRRASSDGS